MVLITTVSTGTTAEHHGADAESHAAVVTGIPVVTGGTAWIIISGSTAVVARSTAVIPGGAAIIIVAPDGGVAAIAKRRNHRNLCKICFTVVAIGSGIGAAFDVVPLFSVSLAAGVAVMFWGFLQATAPAPASRAGGSG